MADVLKVVVICDCDPDRPRYGGARYDSHRSAQKWRGLSEGIGSMQERLKGIEQAAGIQLKAVFALRSDIQMKEIYGTPSWPIEHFADTWRRLEEDGHELAWHPHLWRWSDEWGCWFQETQDSQWINDCLEIGFSGFCESLRRSPTTCHMGWTFHDNLTMKKLSELGLQVDFSASPGVRFEGGPGDGGTKFDNRIDWLGTPQKWYRPSEADYRRPRREGEAELDIAEIPKFTSGAGILKKAKELASRGKKLSGSQGGTSVFLQVTASPLLYGRIIKERLSCGEAEPFFVTYFHPDELLADRPRSAKAFLYSLANLERNLVGLVQVARKKGRSVAFVTGAGAIQHIRGSGEN